MLSGKVLSTGEAVVNIRERGPSGQVAQIEAAVDTGFNDRLTLPPWVIEKLGLEFRDVTTYTLADGVKSATHVFEGEIEWHGVWTPVPIVEIESDPLLGMVMMQGYRLTIDIIEGGSVQLTPLPNSN